MSRGLGHIQRECLRVIAEYEAAGIRPTTFTIVAEVYHVERDQDGNRMCTDAQHVAIKRALAGLRRKGLVVSYRDTGFTPGGTKTDRAIAAELGVSLSTMRRARENAGHRYQNAQRCCLWSMPPSPPQAQ